MEKVSIWTRASRTLWAHHHGNLQRDPHLSRVTSAVNEFYDVHLSLSHSLSALSRYKVICTKSTNCHESPDPWTMTSDCRPDWCRKVYFPSLKVKGAISVALKLPFKTGLLSILSCLLFMFKPHLKINVSHCIR